MAQPPDRVQDAPPTDVAAHRAPSRGVVTVALLALHGGLHLIGVAGAFGLAQLADLAAPISRAWGCAWAFAALLLLAAAVLRARDARTWWMVGVPAIIASQLVITAFWGDAKVGTVANALLLVPLAIGVGRWRFAARVQGAIAGLAQREQPTLEAHVTDDDLATLPPIVATWLRRAGVVGRARPNRVHVRQRGSMQKAPGGAWLSFRAQQWFAVPTPSFVWAVEVDAGPGLHLEGVDAYLDRGGSMRIELLSLLPVVDAAGPNIDQSALIRFLAEIMWFPSAALAPYLRWQAIDEHRARATLRHGEREATGVFRFDEHGDVVGFEARRHREDELEDWIIENDPASFAVLDAARVPTRSTVTWRNAVGETWTWLRLELLSVDRR